MYNRLAAFRIDQALARSPAVAILGPRQVGKTTLARLLAAQLAPMEGAMNASGRMRVGYFTQYQVEELDRDETPLRHMTIAMPGATPGAVRAQLGRFGGNISKTANFIGMERSALHRKIKLLGLTSRNEEDAEV